MQAANGNLCVCEGRQIKSHHQLNGLQLCNIKWIGGRDRDRTGDLLVANEAEMMLRRGAAITYELAGAFS